MRLSLALVRDVAASLKLLELNLLREVNTVRLGLEDEAFGLLWLRNFRLLLAFSSEDFFCLLLNASDLVKLVLLCFLQEFEVELGFCFWFLLRFAITSTFWSRRPPVVFLDCDRCQEPAFQPRVRPHSR